MSNATKINLDTASRVDVTCRKGDTFSLRLTITTSTGAAGFAKDDVFLFQVRDSDTGSVVTNDSSTAFSKSVTATDSDVSNTFVDITVTAADMKTMPSGLYVYDVEQKVPGTSPAPDTVSTLIFGTLKVNEDVSITA